MSAVHFLAVGVRETKLEKEGLKNVGGIATSDHSGRYFIYYQGERER